MLSFVIAHRRENLGEPMHHMFRALRRVLDEHSECKAVYQIHMNPVVRQAADEELGDCKQFTSLNPLKCLTATTSRLVPISVSQTPMDYRKSVLHI